MLAFNKNSPFAVNEVVGQAAQLGALASVGATSLQHLADGATAAVTHAQRPMDKRLERHSSHLANCGDFVQCQFARHNQLGEPEALKETGFFRGAQVALGAGMQGNGWQVQAQQPKVLDDERIHADAVQLMNEPFNLHQLIVIDERVDRRIDAASKPVGVIAGPAHVIQRVARIGTRAMMRRTHVHRISAMVDGGNGNVGVTCGRQQLYEGRLLHKAVLQGCSVAVLSCCQVDRGSAAVSRCSR